jgi:DNA-binding HxlR family transcriptional regulator
MPLQSTYEGQTCSIAGALEVVGERWTLLIVRDIMLGIRRFDELQASLGIARNVLQTRLERLVAADVLERRSYCDHPPRFEYHLTEKGLELWPTVISLMRWGDRHAAPSAGPPVVITHRGCGGDIDDHRICVRCGEKLGPRDVLASPGPGAVVRPS